MKPFEAHVKQWTIVTHRTKKARRGWPLVKWVTVVLQVPTGSWKTARSIGARLSRHMRKPLGRSVTVGEGLGDAASERDFAYAALHRWQDWSLKLHRRLGLVDDRTLPDDTKGRAKLRRIILANVGGCRMGIYCSEHKFVHGFEAEHLRQELEKLIKHGGDVPTAHGYDAVSTEALQRLLEDVDARDSLAYHEIQGRVADKACG